MAFVESFETKDVNEQAQANDGNAPENGGLSIEGTDGVSARKPKCLGQARVDAIPNDERRDEQSEKPFHKIIPRCAGRASLLNKHWRFPIDAPALAPATKDIVAGSGTLRANVPFRTSLREVASTIKATSRE
jgi:hypothetical protein